MDDHFFMGNFYQIANKVFAEIPISQWIFRIISSVRGLFLFNTSETLLALTKYIAKSFFFKPSSSILMASMGSGDSIGKCLVS